MNKTPWIAAALSLLLAGGAWADAVSDLRNFARDAKTGRAQFSQTVTAPDGVRKKQSSGSFEFARPGRFRFAYTKPFEQLILSDGAKLWIFDPDLNQASSRKIAGALGTTPAALLAGGAIEAEFELVALPSAQGLNWVLATPRATDAGSPPLKIGFRDGQLAALDMVDAFGQRSQIQFSAMTLNLPLTTERFRFNAPKGVELIEQ